jgi:hypothetical protein
MRSERRFSYRRDGSVVELSTDQVIGYLTRTRNGYWIEPLGQVSHEVFVSRDTAAGVMCQEYHAAQEGLRADLEPEREESPTPGPAVYLSRPELAARIGVAADSVGKYKLPPPDAMVGNRPGWLPETVDEWNASRPGRGNWGTRTEEASNA